MKGITCLSFLFSPSSIHPLSLLLSLSSSLFPLYFLPLSSPIFLSLTMSSFPKQKLLARQVQLWRERVIKQRRRVFALKGFISGLFWNEHLSSAVLLCWFCKKVLLQEEIELWGVRWKSNENTSPPEAPCSPEEAILMMSLFYTL